MIQLVLLLTCLDKAALEPYAQRAAELDYTFATLTSFADADGIYHLHQECRKAQPPLDTHQDPQDPNVWRMIWMAQPEHYHVLLFKD